MEDEFGFTQERTDQLCDRVAVLCQIADTVETTTNKQVHRRLYEAMDLVIATLKPKQRGTLVDVTSR